MRVVVAHVATERDAIQALDTCVDGLAHQFVDVPLSTELARRIADTFVTMTLSIYHPTEGARYAADERVRPCVAPRWIDNLATVDWEILRSAEWADYGRRALSAVEILRQEHIRILAGTDVPSPGTAHGVSMHHELELLVRGGLSPIEGLTAATSAVADRYGLLDRGRIAPGYRADLVLMVGDPTTEIADTLNIERVWRGGVEVDRSVGDET